MPYPIIFDARHAIWNAYDLLGTPTNVMYDSAGKIVDYSITLSAYAAPAVASVSMVASMVLSSSRTSWRSLKMPANLFRAPVRI